MKKIFSNPMLHVVSIQKKDIITDSLVFVNSVAGIKGGDESGLGFAPDRFDNWDAGY